MLLCSVVIALRCGNFLDQSFEVVTYFFNFAKYNHFTAMSKFIDALKKLRSYISPVYVTLVVAAFVLWYITKLGEVYTTDHEVVVIVDGEEIDVDCIIRGKGTNLIGYTLFSKQDVFEIPSTELTFDMESIAEDGTPMHHIATTSLQQAIAARMTGVEVISVGSIAPIRYALMCE